MSDELETAKELAIGAGAILLKHFSQKTAVRWKGKGNPVTDADQEASRFIVESLHRLFPLDGILSEEEVDNPARLNKSRVWIIDPMDGTSEFVAGRTEFTVMIGLAVDGKPVMGVVYLPVEKKLYFAESGRGAFFGRGSIEAAASRVTGKRPSPGNDCRQPVARFRNVATNSRGIGRGCCRSCRWRWFESGHALRGPGPSLYSCGSRNKSVGRLRS